MGSKAVPLAATVDDARNVKVSDEDCLLLLQHDDKGQQQDCEGVERIWISELFNKRTKLNKNKKDKSTANSRQQKR